MFIYQPPKPDRRIKMMHGRAPERQADKTLEHVSRGWMPVNPHVLRSVREKVESGEFGSDPQSVIEEIKSDPALFVYCVREAVKDLDVNPHVGVDPMLALRGLEEEKLARIVSVSERDISSHRFRHITPAQSMRFQHSLISSRAAEALAPKVELNSELAFSGAIIRQLGYNLIAWNYPDIYNRALVSNKSGASSLDFELQKLLGASPVQIGAKVSRNWNLRPELRHLTMSERERERELTLGDHEIGQTGDGTFSLQRLVEISELFAKANDAEHFPQDARKWERLAKELPEAISVTLTESITPKVAAGIEAFQSATKLKLWTPYFHALPAKEEMPEPQRGLFKRNQYAQRSLEAPRAKLEQAYRMMVPGELSVDALRFLVDHVAGGLGFNRGVLYLLGEKNGVLEPALRLGDLPLSKYPRIRQDQGNAIAESLYTSFPLKQHDASLLDREATRIYGAIEFGKRKGVLVLELADGAEETGNFDSMTHFMALRQSLSDCVPEAFEKINSKT